MRRQNSGENIMESKAGIKVKTEVYSRVSGYYRPVAQWNKAKQAEFKEREKNSEKFIVKYTGTDNSILVFFFELSESSKLSELEIEE